MVNAAFVVCLLLSSLLFGVFAPVFGFPKVYVLRRVQVKTVRKLFFWHSAGP